MRTIITGFVAAFLVLAGSLHAQFTPSGGSSPHAVVKKLSTENFRNIKNLYVAIMNYGGGEAEFNRLVSGYADATGKYFAKEYDVAAESFRANEKDIYDTGMIIGEKYKERTSRLHKQVIDLNVKKTIKTSLDSKKSNPAFDKLISEASESVVKANDLLIRRKPMEAIMLYRRAKEKCIQYYDLIGEPLPEEYERDRKDNAVEIYTAKEKQN